MVTKDEAIEINKKILAVSGTSFDSFGLPNQGNLDYALNLARQQNSPIQEGAVLMHEIIRGQPFTNANKRTGLEIGIGVIESGCYLFEATPNEKIDFTKSVLIENKSREDVENWLKEHSKFTGERKGFLAVTKTNIDKDKEFLKKLD